MLDVKGFMNKTSNQKCANEALQIAGLFSLFFFNIVLKLKQVEPLIFQVMSYHKDKKGQKRFLRRNGRQELQNKILNHKSQIHHANLKTDARFKVTIQKPLQEEDWSPVCKTPYLPLYFFLDSKGVRKRIGLN